MAGMEAPPNLDALRAISDPSELALAAGLYISQRLDAIERAREVRDDAIAQLMRNGMTAPEAAKASGMSLGHVRGIQRWAHRLPLTASQ